ncbi:MAG: NAD(P)H-binding protein [Bacteroidetes bacterium]|nr:NAD(P)H-binding protein [Bacteroidota bacterium]
MKFTVTGSLGNISQPLSKILINAGHQVTIISSNPSKKQEIEKMGAKAAIGSITDIGFLTKSFAGADAIYTMVPPNFGAANYRQYIAEIGKNYAAAIKSSGITRVVNLSSIGAHLSQGTGPIAGLHDVEIELNALEGVAVKHLRAGFFYTNFLQDIGMIKSNNIIGNNYSAQARLAMVHPKDIAEAAAQELQQSFAGKSYQYVISDERKVSDVVKTLGTAIGKPALPWVEFSDEQSFGGMTNAGLPVPVAETFVEMGTAVRKGILWTDYDQNKPKSYGKTKLEDFANEFAEAFN